MPSLFFDGDLRRIYEVPDDSSFIVDGGGYRIYTPNNPITAATLNQYTASEIWSRWVDYHNANKWTTLALSKSAGQFIEEDAEGNEVFADIDLRLTEGWQLVPANYPHEWRIVGNARDEVSLESTFDSGRITSPGVFAYVQFNPTTQLVRQVVNANLQRLVDIAEGDEEHDPDQQKAFIRHKDTKEVLVEKDVTEGTGPAIHLQEPAP